MARLPSHPPEGRPEGGGSRPVPRRAFLQGVLGGAAAAAAGSLVSTGVADAQEAGYLEGYNELAAEDATRSIPFYGQHQAGIATPPQSAGEFLSFDVTASSRRELVDLFRTLTERAAFLTNGGGPPRPRLGRAPEEPSLLGATVVPDDLTVTVALGASIFDDRFGLSSRKPAELEVMRAFTHDKLDPQLTHGDLLVQLCANHHDTVGNAMLDVLAQTSGATQLRWRMPGFRPPPRPVGVARDWLGFKDGIAQPTPDQFSQVVWVQPGRPEPAWTAGGTYQVVRMIRNLTQQWDKVSVEQQERIIGRRKISGAPLYATDPNASDTLDPIYTNDPQGLLTPLNCHIRLANPQTPQTAATSAILRRSYHYDRTPDENAQADVGHTFCCFQQKLGTYITMQNRLENELLAPYLTPFGGGYFFAVPGVRDAHDYFASGLLQ
jgi:deferrochelatase/peroxidase EfeB